LQCNTECSKLGSRSSQTRITVPSDIPRFALSGYAFSLRHLEHALCGSSKNIRPSPNHEQSEVVSLLCSVGEVDQVGETLLNQLRRIQSVVPHDEVYHAPKVILFASGVVRLGQSVRVKHETVLNVEREAMNRETITRKHAEGNFGRTSRPDAIVRYMQKRQMSGADELDGPVAPYVSCYKSCKVAVRCTLGEDAIGSSDHPIQGKIGKTAKNCSKMTYQHRRSNSLARYIAK
jgi:hypothetical protein